jgi:hypothetical protein
MEVQQKFMAQSAPHIFRLSLALLCVAMMLNACSRSGPGELRDASDFSVTDWTGDQVKERFGEPDRVQRIQKTSESIWGPAESFWELVPMNSTMVIWSYHVKGGDMELYFIEPDAVVQGVAFAPEGVVYESSEE